jgi:hypothetical protein
MSKKHKTRPQAKPMANSRFRRLIESFWVERTIFVSGILIVFFADQIFGSYTEKARGSVEYYNEIIPQIQKLSRQREEWLVEYNKAVAATPQNRELLGHYAYSVYTDTDQLLTLLRAVHQFDGGEQGLQLIREKNERRAAATAELKAGNVEALVNRVNLSHDDHDQIVEPLTLSLMLKLRLSQVEASKWTRRITTARQVGAVLAAAAFVMRERHEYRKRKQNSG